MESLFVPFFLAVIGIFIAVIVLDRQARLKRTVEMRTLAARLGYEYAEEAEVRVPLDRLGLLSRGHSHRTSNLLRTEVDGGELMMFDWTYTVGHGKHRHIYRQSTLCLESARLDLPRFTLRPEGFGSKILGMLGQQDIDLEGQIVFSEAYVLQGPDEARVRALFDAARCDFFARRPGLSVHGEGHLLIYYRSGRRLGPADLPAFAEEGLAAVRLFAREAPAPAAEPDSLAGLDELLAEMGVEQDEASAGTAGA